jgi:hypothetical protein
LVSEQPIEWQVGQSLLLSIDDERLEVRLANVSSETIAPTDADGPPIIRTRLGVTRMAEVSAGRLALAKRPMLLALYTPLRGICAAIVCILLIALAMGLLSGFQQRVSYWFDQLR